MTLLNTNAHYEKQSLDIIYPRIVSMVIPIAQIVLQYNDLLPIRLYHSIQVNLLYQNVDLMLFAVNNHINEDSSEATDREDKCRLHFYI